MKNRTESESEYIAFVKSLGCYMNYIKGYGFREAEAHHVSGRGFDLCDFLCVPLSGHFHRDNIDGIHGQRRAWGLAKQDEMKALAWVIKNLWEENNRLKYALSQTKIYGA